jgi:hypothetical protein
LKALGIRASDLPHLNADVMRHTITRMQNHDVAFGEPSDHLSNLGVAVADLNVGEYRLVTIDLENGLLVLIPE